ncbi:MAG: 2-C-methyl-D-erythritol 4-phosphate cytidylyltransferase [Bacilli bacterium]|nr:2-C-methyl-D-erythritol 4-phosphate cytidylyltransferase [Bacilli bacterium]
MIYAEILAGGSGKRMGNTEMPKQFLMLGNKPIFIHTVEQFLINTKIDKILVCCPNAWISHTKDMLHKYLTDTSKIEVVEGGSNRNETIINGCEFINENYGINDDDIIITHDAVRPFINQRIIDDNIEMAKKYNAVDTVISAIDTIVESKDGKIISSIPVRNEMYQGQTPQSFNLKKLMELYYSLNEEEKDVLTDACKIFVIKGEDVHIVNGEVYNIKITTLHDLKLSNAILLERNKND